MAEQEEPVASQETLLEMLRRLPPSKELLDFYHQKVQDFAAEEKKWLDRLSNSRVLTGQIQKLDKELSNQKREIAALQKAVTDMQSALVQERKISAKIYAENDKLKIQELENRRKVLALLEMLGQTDQASLIVVLVFCSKTCLCSSTSTSHRNRTSWLVISNWM